ncbi:MAG: hypothetical protein HQK49_17585 [Oligoflexia bacterium]|nr:hypothetical protein [Oligoflexia bacterium]
MLRQLSNQYLLTLITFTIFFLLSLAVTTIVTITTRATIALASDEHFFRKSNIMNTEMNTEFKIDNSETSLIKANSEKLFSAIFDLNVDQVEKLLKLNENEIDLNRYYPIDWKNNNEFFYETPLTYIARRKWQSMKNFNNSIDGTKIIKIFEMLINDPHTDIYKKNEYGYNSQELLVDINSNLDTNENGISAKLIDSLMTLIETNSDKLVDAISRLDEKKVKQILTAKNIDINETGKITYNHDKKIVVDSLETPLTFIVKNDWPEDKNTSEKITNIFKSILNDPRTNISAMNEKKKNAWNLLKNSQSKQSTPLKKFFESELSKAMLKENSRRLFLAISNLDVASVNSVLDEDIIDLNKKMFIDWQDLKYNGHNISDSPTFFSNIDETPLTFLLKENWKHHTNKKNNNESNITIAKKVLEIFNLLIDDPDTDVFATNGNNQNAFDLLMPTNEETNKDTNDIMPLIKSSIKNKLQETTAKKNNIKLLNAITDLNVEDVKKILNEKYLDPNGQIIVSMEIDGKQYDTLETPLTYLVGVDWENEPDQNIHNKVEEILKLLSQDYRTKILAANGAGQNAWEILKQNKSNTSLKKIFAKGLKEAITKEYNSNLLSAIKDLDITKVTSLLKEENIDINANVLIKLKNAKDYTYEKPLTFLIKEKWENDKVTCDKVMAIFKILINHQNIDLFNINRKKQNALSILKNKTPRILNENLQNLNKEMIGELRELMIKRSTQKLFQAIKNLDVSSVKKLLEENTINLNALNDDSISSQEKETPLTYLIKNQMGNSKENSKDSDKALQIFQMLLNDSRTDVFATNKFEKTAWDLIKNINDIRYKNELKKAIIRNNNKKLIQAIADLNEKEVKRLLTDEMIDLNQTSSAMCVHDGNNRYYWPTLQTPLTYIASCEWKSDPNSLIKLKNIFQLLLIDPRVDVFTLNEVKRSLPQILSSYSKPYNPITTLLLKVFKESEEIKKEINKTNNKNAKYLMKYVRKGDFNSVVKLFNVSSTQTQKHLLLALSNSHKETAVEKALRHIEDRKNVKKDSEYLKIFDFLCFKTKEFALDESIFPMLKKDIDVILQLRNVFDTESTNEYSNK